MNRKAPAEQKCTVQSNYGSIVNQMHSSKCHRHPRQGSFALPATPAHLEELVEGAEAAREDHDTVGLVHHPELAREEVVELEGQLGGDVLVGGRGGQGSSALSTAGGGVGGLGRQGNWATGQPSKNVVVQ